ncbi:hypothetical protein [Micromonospora sp. NPDC047730]|uniref:hypothetical protein n=1 Tax=Micromonospora sp. NPDC047730 TaxID=3364253 RepID=UPI00370F9623
MSDVALFEVRPKEGLPASTVLVDAPALRKALQRIAKFPGTGALAKTRADVRCVWLWGCDRNLALFGQDGIAAGQYKVPTEGPAARVPLLGVEPKDVKGAVAALDGLKGLVGLSVLGDRLMLTPRDEKTPGWVASLVVPSERDLRHLRLLMGKIISHTQRITEGRAKLPHASVCFNPALAARFAGEPQDTRLWFTSEYGGVLFQAGPHFCGVAMPVRPRVGSSAERPIPMTPDPLPVADLPRFSSEYAEEGMARAS